MQKNLFKTGTPVKKENAFNSAGGTAYALSDAESLAQYCVVGVLNNTYYVSAKNHLDIVQSLCEKVDSETIAKCAVYGRQRGKMKDIPAYLVAVLCARGENTLLEKVFPQVINNVKMLTNFVQIIRSGVTGRRSFGSCAKRLISDWLNSRTPESIFAASIGANPSIADIIKMVHPKPATQQHEALYAYLIDKSYEFSSLPTLVQHFEQFKKEGGETPNVPFRALTNCDLSTNQWQQIAKDMPWNTLRMNLNMLHKREVFNDSSLVKELSDKIKNEEQVKKFNAFPHELFAAYSAISKSDIPRPITNAVQSALEISLKNVPNLGNVIVAIDTSGSMESAATGSNGRSSDISCLDTASLFAAAINKSADDCKNLIWASTTASKPINNMDSLSTIQTNFSRSSGDVGHGTDVSQCLRYINNNNMRSDVLVILSDVDTWMHGLNRNYEAWLKFKRHNKNAKLILINCHAGQTCMIPDDKDVLNVSGFSDQVFDVIAEFMKNNGTTLLGEIQKVQI